MDSFFTSTRENEFNLSLFQSLLKTKYIGRSLVYRSITESTMDIASSEAQAGCPTGTLVLAEYQTKGKGSKGRTWESTGKGKSLYFTIVFHLAVEHASELIKLNLSIPVVTSLSLKHVGLKNVGIKWPNDVWVYSDEDSARSQMPKKISGTLITSTQIGELISASAGIGINLNQSFKDEPIQDINNPVAITPTSVVDMIGKQTSREEFLAYFCNTLESILGFSRKDVITLFKDNDILVGRKVNIIPTDTTKSTIVGKVIAISQFGNLVVELEDGTTKELIAEEVSIRPQQ